MWRSPTQHYLEAAFARLAPGILLHVVSLDVVINSQWGDARNRDTKAFWLGGALRGFVHAGLCGPPCETWSQARFVQLVDTLRRQPRPLRSLDDLWGLPSLSLREQPQVAIGNELLLFAIDLLVCLACSGGLRVLEHPGPPADVSRPSIWRLPLVELVSQLPGFQTIDFAQGLLGAKSPKPTRFLALNMESLPQQIHRHRLRPDLPKTSAIGHTADGHWATTALKEYPPALNRALGESFAIHLLQSTMDQEQEIDPGFIDKCRLMHVSTYGTRIGPDFCA